jgi:hypothetical protein
MSFGIPGHKQASKLAQARVIAAVTTLICLVLGGDAMGGDSPASHRMGVTFLSIVGVAAVAAFQSAGEARPMRRWLSLLAALQIASWGLLLWPPARSPWVISAMSALILAGWLLALSRVVSELRDSGTG